jgi:hypothetical protein
MNIYNTFVGFINKFCYSVYNQYASFIYLYLIVKNMDVSPEKYFK